MARIFIDGFELGTDGLWSVVSGAINSTDVITGSYSYSLKGLTAFLEKSLGTTYTEIYAAMNVHPLNISTVQDLLSFKNDTATIGGARSNQSGMINLFVGTAVVATSTFAVSTSNNYRFEIFYKVATVDGLIEVKINNSTVVSYAGNTQPTTFAKFNTLHVGGISPYYSSLVIDDVVIDTTGWPGNGRVAAVVPAAAGDSTGWTPSVSSNWECVEEIPAATADYVHTNTTGALDLYGLSALPANTTNINCVQVSAFVEKEGTPAFNDIYLALSLNSTVALSEALTPGAAGSPLWISKVWELNPMTGSSFTVAEFSSIQIGIQGATT